VLSVVFGFFGFHDLFSIGKVSRECQHAARQAKLTVWPRLCPREFLAALNCLGPGQVQRLDLMLNHRPHAPWEDVKAGLGQFATLRRLEIFWRPDGRDGRFVWKNVDLAALTVLTLTNVSVAHFALEGLPSLVALRLRACRSKVFLMPPGLRELHVIRDETLELDELMFICASLSASLEILHVVSYLHDHLRLDPRALLQVCRRSKQLRILTAQSFCFPRDTQELRDLARDCKSACPTLHQVCLLTESNGHILNQVDVKC
jgi:hypothetical protein